MSYLVRKGKDFFLIFYKKESKLPACVNAKKNLSLRDNLHKSVLPQFQVF